jgi:RNA polymerase sigma-70 factor (ECF subfamily)
MLATALARLGDLHRADDVVQDACLAALRHIGALRDPDAVAGWLGAIVRTACLRAGGTPAAELPDELPAPGTPEERIERLELAEWVWAALHALPEPQRAAAMLRWFGRWSSYEEIAAILGVPVGTVRSRLHHARRALAASLLDTAARADTTARALTAAQTRDFGAAMADIDAGRGYDAFAAAFAEDVEIALSGGEVHHGRTVLRDVLEGDLLAGVGFRLDRLLASPTLTIIEATLVSPRDDPTRCPPATCQVHWRPDGLTTRARLWFSERPRATSAAA